jgi:hypothetical protein
MSSPLHDPDYLIPGSGPFIYFEYKLAVYDNLFTGIACGEGQDTSRYSSNF